MPNNIGPVIENLHTLAAPATTAPWWAVPSATLAVGVATVCVAIYSINKASSNAKSALIQAGDVAKKQIATATENAKRQTQATVISANRQRWIDAVRDDVAGLLAAELRHRALEQRASATDATAEALKERDLQLTDLYLLQNRLTLRLNPSKELHIELQEATQALVGSDNADADQHARKVVKAAKALLKAEWERVKREATGDFPVSSAAEN